MMARCSDKFDFAIAGIPCQIAVVSVTPFVPAFISGPPENCYPAEGGEAEYEVLDRRGYKAGWLQRKITDDIDSDNIEKILERAADG